MERTVRALFRKYFDWCQKHRSPCTAQWYDEHLARFLAHLGNQADRPLASLKPYHVVEWVDGHETWGDSYKRGSILAVQRACNYTFRSRKQIEATAEQEAMLETKYRCTGCGKEWKETVPGVLKKTPPPK